MRECRTCDWKNGLHDPACPELPGLSSTEESEALREYNAGWGSGRRGDEAPKKDEVHPSYYLGFLKGYVSLEVAENTSWSDYYG